MPRGCIPIRVNALCHGADRTVIDVDDCCFAVHGGAARTGAHRGGAGDGAAGCNSSGAAANSCLLALLLWVVISTNEYLCILLSPLHLHSLKYCRVRPLREDSLALVWILQADAGGEEALGPPAHMLRGQLGGFGQVQKAGCAICPDLVSQPGLQSALLWRCAPQH